MTLEQRDHNEKAFFNKAPFNVLPKERTGIKALKLFLGKLLYDHIRGEFPALVQEIRTRVTQCRTELEALGAPRQNTVQQRHYLSQVASTYQLLVLDCLRGGYDASWDANNPRKLRMHIHLLNDKFAEKISKNGHTFAFCNADDTQDKEYSAVDANTHIYDWIRQTYRESRGAELPGIISPMVLENLFRKQASKWAVIAQAHLQDIDHAVVEFNSCVWPNLVADQCVREHIEGLSTARQRHSKDQAMQQLDQLIADEMHGILQTVNHYFADNIANLRTERVTNRLRDLGLSDSQHAQVTLTQALRAAHRGNEDQAVYDIHDNLKAYYKVALKRFMDNVVIQCVERYFLGADGPVKHISPAYVGSLSDDELDTIAAENYATSMLRAEVSQRLQRLEKALQIAEKERL